MKIRATPEQWAIIEDPARIKVAICGRRWGKTILQLLALAVTAQRYPGCKVWYVSLSYSRVMSAMRTMQRSAGFMQYVRHAYTQFPPRFEMRNGSEFSFRSADRPDLLLGEGLKMFALDEASRTSADLCQRVLMPMLADTHGFCILGTTYNGRNWLYELAEKGKRDGRIVKTWVYPTSAGMRFQTPSGKAELAMLRTQYPEGIWKQEFECEPLATQDAVFRYIDRVLDGVVPVRPDPQGRYICGFDIGRVKDNSVAVVIDARNGNVAHCEIFPLGQEIAIQSQRLGQIRRAWNNCVVIADTTSKAADSFIKLFRQEVPDLQAMPWNRDRKNSMVNELALAIEQRRIHIPPQFTELIAQCRLYKFKMPEGAIYPVYTAPSGEHDDAVAALMMANWGRIQGMGGSIPQMFPG